MNSPDTLSPAAPRFDALYNFRDFGGYETADGRRVRRGRLYRSDMLCDLSDADQAYLDSLDLGLVCDLRSRTERDHHPDRWPGNKPVLTLSLDDSGSLDAVRPERWQKRLSDPSFDARKAHESLLDNYVRMPQAYSNDIQELLRFLAEQPHQGVLVHCAVGKDRTGFVCSMLLWTLGVPLPIILGEYLRTGIQFPAEALLRHRGSVIPHSSDDPRVRGAMRTLASVHEDFLMGAINEAARLNGSVDAYLAERCGLTAERRAAVKANLLE